MHGLQNLPAFVPACGKSIPSPRFSTYLRAISFVTRPSLICMSAKWVHGVSGFVLHMRHGAASWDIPNAWGVDELCSSRTIAGGHGNPPRVPSEVGRSG